MYSFQYARRRGLVPHISNPFKFRWEQKQGKYCIVGHEETLIESWLLEHRPELFEEFQSLERYHQKHICNTHWRLRTTASNQLSGAFSWPTNKWSHLYGEILREESQNH